VVVDGGFEEVGVCFEPGLVEVSEDLSEEWFWLDTPFADVERIC
jgi:hypothetical protein